MKDIEEVKRYSFKPYLAGTAWKGEPLGILIENEEGEWVKLDEITRLVSDIFRLSFTNEAFPALFNEADEINDEDLEAAAEFYDKLHEKGGEKR